MRSRTPGNSPAAPDRDIIPTYSIDRRRFLLLAGGGLAYATLRPHLAWARRAARVRPVLQPWSLHDDPPSQPVELARALIGAAVLAPNNWNSQPWLFEVEGASIRLVADTRRSLPITDPDQRCMMISLGAALENLLVAARAYGLRPKVVYRPHQGAGHVAAEVTWSGGDVRRDRSLFAVMTSRRTNRREYDGRGIFPQNRVQLLAQAPEGIRIHWLDDRERVREIADIAHDAVEARLANTRVQAEQYAWMRFGDDDARRRGDGVSIESLEIGGPARWIARRSFNPRSWFHGIGIQSAAKQMRAGIRSAGALALLTAVRAGETQWVIGGQAYERFALEATQLGIAHQPLSEPLAHEPAREAILKSFGTAAVTEEPLLLVRLGHAKRPRPTVRRHVALVASFRNS